MAEITSDLISIFPSFVEVLQFVHYKDILNCKLVNRRIREVILRNSRSMPKMRTREEMDMFTSCHSLLDILSYVDYKDIQNIKLVSGQLYDIIKNNGIRLPRYKITLLQIDVDDNRFIGRDVVFLKLSCSKKQHLYHYDIGFEVCITDQRLRIWDCPQPILEKLKETFSTFVEGRTRDDGDIFTILAGYNKCHQDFQIRNLEEGLERISAVIFRQFYFKKINIINKLDNIRVRRREKWFEIIGDEFKKMRSKCCLVNVEACTPGIDGFYLKLDPTETQFLPNTTVRDLLRFQTLDFDFVIHELFEDIASLDPLICLLKKWEAAVIQIRRLFILFQTRLSHNKVRRAMKPFSILRRYKVGDKMFVLKVKRPTDNSYLYITHSCAGIDISETSEFDWVFDRHLNL